VKNSPNHGDIFIFPEDLVSRQHFEPVQDSGGDYNPYKIVGAIICLVTGFAREAQDGLYKKCFE
jgi:hypothetical protein